MTVEWSRMAMRLEKIGFNAWFQDRLNKENIPDMQPARVAAVNRNSYLVTDGSRTITAELTGKMLFNAESPLDYPAVGDWVYVQVFDSDSLALIHEIFPRRTLLKRKVAGKRVDIQLIAANIDTAIIIQSLDSDFNLRRLERYLVMINESEAVPVVLMSKSDLTTPEEVAKKVAEIHGLMPDIKVIAINCVSENGLDMVKDELTPGKTFCLMGTSGVGKTTLINSLLKAEVYETQAVRESDGSGRHTTTRRQLVFLENGAMIIDTPGMRELGNVSEDEGLVDTFVEIVELAAQCRYNDCSHLGEDGCAVQAALVEGTLAADRFENYLKLKKESEYNARSYRESRERDRKFGKYCKSVMKDKKKERP